MIINAKSVWTGLTSHNVLYIIYNDILVQVGGDRLADAGIYSRKRQRTGVEKLGWLGNFDLMGFERYGGFLKHF